MLNLKELNDSQLDFFRELENIGASHAVTALSVLLNQSISIKVPRVQFCEFNHICDMLNGPETLVAGLMVEISGDINGFILLVQNARDARHMAEMITDGVEYKDQPKKGEFLTELQFSALQEVVNILAGSFVTAISSLTGLTIKCSVPELIIDMAGAVMSLPAVTYGKYGDIALFLETEFWDSEDIISGHFFLIPEIGSYDLLIRKMGIS